MLQKEQIIQINYLNWVEHHYPDIFKDTYHFANERFFIPNENGSHFQAGRKLKRMGVKKGVYDIFHAVPCDGYNGLWIEIKSEKGKLSTEQISFGERMISRGYMAIAVWGEEAAKKVFDAYFQH